MVVVGIPAVYQSTAPKSRRVRPERGDDRVETHPTDQEPVQEAGADRGEERDADRGPEPRVVAGRVLGDDHDVEGEAAGHREVDAALHDDERLAERRDRERRRERQHRQDDALFRLDGANSQLASEQRDASR